ncbi:MAG: metal ABC transporter substrate-binding protein [Gemmatimonadota bacterium]
MTNRFIRSAAVALVALAVGAAYSAPKLRVVATTADLASIAREIGGDAVDVVALAKPTEDPHFVDAKPSHIVTLNRADVLLDGGAELELGWLPPLLESSRNARIAAGAAGRLSASHLVKMLEVPSTFDRSMGDVHSQGNPHFLIDPLNAKLVAAAMAERFAAIDAPSSALYKTNLATFNATLDARLAVWQRQMEPHRGAKIVTYHKDFVYLANRFNLEVVETLEPKPGIAPSAAHLAKVIEAMKATSTRVILVQPYQNRRTAETVARQAGAVVLDISQQPGGHQNARTYFDMMDYMISTLAAALGSQK